MHANGGYSIVHEQATCAVRQLVTFHQLVTGFLSDSGATWRLKNNLHIIHTGML